LYFRTQQITAVSTLHWHITHDLARQVTRLQSGIVWLVRKYTACIAGDNTIVIHSRR